MEKHNIFKILQQDQWVAPGYSKYHHLVHITLTTIKFLKIQVTYHKIIVYPYPTMKKEENNLRIKTTLTI